MSSAGGAAEMVGAGRAGGGGRPDMWLRREGEGVEVEVMRFGELYNHVILDCYLSYRHYRLLPLVGYDPTLPLLSL